MPATIFIILSVLCHFFLYYFSTKQRHMDRVVCGKSDNDTMDQAPQATLDDILVDWTDSDGSWFGCGVESWMHGASRLVGCHIK
jgi:hypothetical protein